MGIGVESGMVGFGDGPYETLFRRRGDLSNRAKRKTDLSGINDWQASGFSFLGVTTGADGQYPIERAIDSEGRVRGLRVEFVSDVAEVDGQWREVGRLVITAGRCVVADPHSMHANEGFYFHDVGAPNGNHSIEVFFWDWEHLGARILFATPLDLPQWGVD